MQPYRRAFSIQLQKIPLGKRYEKKKIFLEKYYFEFLCVMVNKKVVYYIMTVLKI